MASRAVIREDGKLVLQATMDTSTLAITLSPSGTAGSLGASSLRLAALSDPFALFRFTKLEFHVGPVFGTASSVLCAIGFTPMVPDTAATTFATVMDQPCSMQYTTTTAALYGGNQQRRILRVPKKILRGGLTPWFRTRESSAADVNQESQGQITFFMGSGTTDVTTVEVHYTIELKDYIGTGQTPRKPNTYKEPQPLAEVASGSNLASGQGTTRQGDRVFAEVLRRLVDRTALPPEGEGM